MDEILGQLWYITQYIIWQQLLTHSWKLLLPHLVCLHTKIKTHFPSSVKSNSLPAAFVNLQSEAHLFPLYGWSPDPHVLHDSFPQELSPKTTVPCGQGMHFVVFGSINWPSGHGIHLKSRRKHTPLTCLSMFHKWRYSVSTSISNFSTKWITVLHMVTPAGHERTLASAFSKFQDNLALRKAIFTEQGRICSPHLSAECYESITHTSQMG